MVDVVGVRAGGRTVGSEPPKSGVYEGYHNTMVDFLRNPFIREWSAVPRGG